MPDRPGETDYLVTTTFRVRAQSAEQAVNEVREHLHALDGDLLGVLTDMWQVLTAHRIRKLDPEPDDSSMGNPSPAQVSALLGEPE